MLSTLIRRGLRRGVIDGSRPWLVVGVAAGVVALVRKVTANPPETAWREELKPGDTLLIRAVDPQADGA